MGRFFEGAYIVACITALVLLLAEMSIPPRVNPMPILIDRL
jgi:hypothetical protein